MIVAPLCPCCGANGHYGDLFAPLVWDSEECEQHGYDPNRTSAMAFRCLSCGREFPQVAWEEGSMRDPKLGLVDERGNPFNPAYSAQRLH